METDRMERFLDRIARGEKIEANDWMPEDYRHLLLKQIHMHAVSEIMGAYPEKEWVPKAPTLFRKLALSAKVQDEIGHGQLLLRLAEDLASRDGRVRDDLLDDVVDGRVKFHNVFHLEAPTWADAGVIGFLVDGGAIITQASLLDSSYGPYARILKRIVAEESFHMQHGEAVVLALAGGTPGQRAMLQDAVSRWWPAMMFFFGPPAMSSASRQMMQYKIRVKTNEDLRQQFLTRYVPRVQALGITLPDPKLGFDKDQKQWHYTQPDWAWWGQMVHTNQGPKSQERIGLRRAAHSEQRWIRDAVLYAQDHGIQAIL